MFCNQTLNFFSYSYSFKYSNATIKNIVKDL